MIHVGLVGALISIVVFGLLSDAVYILVRAMGYEMLQWENATHDLTKLVGKRVQLDILPSRIVPSLSLP